jgi:hypothetical protein
VAPARLDGTWRVPWRAALDAHFAEIDRLRQLGVRVRELNPASTTELAARFLREFSSTEQAGEALLALENGEALTFEKWLREDCTTRDATGEHLAWLTARARGARCVRLSRRSDLPAVEIEVETMDDAWAASWPGAFLQLDLGRAVVVDLDYQIARLDLHPRHAAPYR